MITRGHLFGSCLLAGVLATLALPATAGLVTVTGSEVSFTYDPSQFAGSPSAAGTGLSFSPVYAQASNGSANTVTTTTSFTISLTDPSVRFESLNLFEQGLYGMSGAGSTVSMTGLLDAADAGTSGATANNSFGPSGGFKNDGNQHSWTTVDLMNLSSSQWADVRSINVTITTRLGASTAAGGNYFAYIGSDASGGDTVSVGVAAVPLPGTLGFAAAGLLTLAAFSRRRAARLPAW